MASGKDAAGGGWEVGLDDVTQDGRTDVLLENEHGSGGCGDRFVLGVGGRHVHELFRCATCETSSRLHDGLLFFTAPVGTCVNRNVHCHAGVRLIIRGWSGRRLVVDRTIVSCRRPTPDPRRGCHPLPY